MMREFVQQPIPKQNMNRIAIEFFSKVSSPHCMPCEWLWRGIVPKYCYWQEVCTRSWCNWELVACVCSPNSVCTEGFLRCGFREGPWTWTGSRCGDAAGQHFPFISTMQNQCHSQKPICLKKNNVRRCCRPAFSILF